MSDQKFAKMAEARRFVLLGIVRLLERERAENDGFSHEITNEFDLRRLSKAITAEINALLRRAKVRDSDAINAEIDALLRREGTSDGDAR